MCLRECLCSWLCTGYKHCMFSLEGGTRSVPTFHIFNPNSLVPCCFPSSSRSCSNCITNTVSDSQYTYVYSETGTHAHCLVQHLKKIETIVQQALVRMWVTDRVNAFNEQQQWRNKQRLHDLSTAIVDYHPDTLPSLVLASIGRSEGLAGGDPSSSRMFLDTYAYCLQAHSTQRELNNSPIPMASHWEVVVPVIVLARKMWSQQRSSIIMMYHNPYLIIWRYWCCMYLPGIGEVTGTLSLHVTADYICVLDIEVLRPTSTCFYVACPLC